MQFRAVQSASDFFNELLMVNERYSPSYGDFLLVIASFVRAIVLNCLMNKVSNRPPHWVGIFFDQPRMRK